MTTPFNTRAADILNAIRSKRASEVTGTRTNTTNPSLLSKLDRDYMGWRAAKNLPRTPLPLEPIEEKLPIDQKFVDQAKVIGCCPYELSVIANYEFDTNNTLVMKAFKDYITAIKLSCEIDFSELNAQLDVYRRRNDSSKQIYDRQKTQAENKNGMRDQRIESARTDLYSTWTDILIHLIQRVETNPSIDSLSEGDKWICLSMEKVDRNAIDLDQDKISINFKVCKNLKSDQIYAVVKNTAVVRMEEQKRQHRLWLINSSIEDLQNKYFEVTDVGARSEIEQEIKKRKSATS